jgi:hypothetical protein
MNFFAGWGPQDLGARAGGYLGLALLLSLATALLLWFILTRRFRAALKDALLANSLGGFAALTAFLAGVPVRWCAAVWLLVELGVLEARLARSDSLLAPLFAVIPSAMALYWMSRVFAG